MQNNLTKMSMYLLFSHIIIHIFFDRNTLYTVTSHIVTQLVST